MPASDEPTEAQLAKLPRWARDRITWLQQKQADAARTIAILSAGPEDSDTFIRDHVHPDRMLGTGTEVSFRLPASDGHEAGQVTAGVSKHGVLEIMAHDGSLHITPQSSNVVRVRIGPY